MLLHDQRITMRGRIRGLGKKTLESDAKLYGFHPRPRLDGETDLFLVAEVTAELAAAAEEVGARAIQRDDYLVGRFCTPFAKEPRRATEILAPVRAMVQDLHAHPDVQLVELWIRPGSRRDAKEAASIAGVDLDADGRALGAAVGGLRVAWICKRHLAYLAHPDRYARDAPAHPPQNLEAFRDTHTGAIDLAWPRSAGWATWADLYFVPGLNLGDEALDESTLRARMRALDTGSDFCPAAIAPNRGGEWFVLRGDDHGVDWSPKPLGIAEYLAHVAAGFGEKNRTAAPPKSLQALLDSLGLDA